MLDMNMFREHADVIRADHTKRGLPHDNIDKVIELDQRWRNLLHETDQLRRAKNEAARGIGAAKKAGDDEAAKTILAEVADLGAKIADMEAKPTRPWPSGTGFACRYPTSFTQTCRWVRTTRATPFTGSTASNPSSVLNLEPTTNLSK